MTPGEFSLKLRLFQGGHDLFQVGDGSEKWQRGGEGRVMGLLAHRGATIRDHDGVETHVASLPGGALNHEIGCHASQ